MKKYVFFWLISFSGFHLSAQLSDRVWFGGYNEYPGLPGYGNFELKFSANGNSIQQVALAFNFESTSAVAANADGELLFYSNGCQVANRLHQVMPNGDGLNPGLIHEQACPWKGYLLPQGAMALPMPGDSTQYYLFHSGATPDPHKKLLLSSFYYSVVDMKKEGGLGDVVEKNTLLLEGDLGNFTAVRHGNGRDWWLLVPAHGNGKWHTFLVTPQGIQGFPPQVMSIGNLGCEHHGQTAVSKDGSKIANWGDCKLTVFNFDRCSGTINAPKEFTLYIHWFGGGGVAFSASGKYLYSTDHNVLYRTDLSNAFLTLDTMRFSYGAGNYAIPGNTFGHLVNGPDGSIYGNISSRAKYFHVLKNADADDLDDIGFNPKELMLPVVNVRTMPHFPNFRLFDLADSPCDSLGINDPMVATKSALAHPEIKLFPNPASRFISFQMPELEKGAKLFIYDATGNRILDAPLNIAQTELEMDVSQFSSGLFAVIVQSGGRYWSGRFIKI